jgi:hypothetical protein
VTGPEIDRKRASWRRIGADKEELICNAYREGYSIESITRLYSVGVGTVCRTLDRHMIERRKPGTPSTKTWADTIPSTGPVEAKPSSSRSSDLDDDDAESAPTDYTALYAQTLGLSTRHVDVWTGDDGMGEPRLFLRCAGRIEAYDPQAVSTWSLRIVCLLREGARISNDRRHEGRHHVTSPTNNKTARRESAAGPNPKAPLESASDDPRS